MSYDNVCESGSWIELRLEGPEIEARRLQADTVAKVKQTGNVATCLLVVL